MYRLHLLFILLFLFNACAPKVEPLVLANKPLKVTVDSVDLLDTIDDKELELLFAMYKSSCKKDKFSKRYRATCKIANSMSDARKFFRENFEIRKIYTKEPHLMTGYYEASLHGSKSRSDRYKYPIYAPPKDMHKPYFTREKINANGINAPVLCYVDDLVDRYFLHVQGSGRVLLDDNNTMMLGYADDNGKPYISIGKEMIKRGYIKEEDISLEAIRDYLDKHPFMVEEILNLNPRYLFFKRTDRAASGSLGEVLTPMHSVATDLEYIPLGTPLIYESNGMRHMALSQDTGAAIKGEVRVDLFFGFDSEAKAKAGVMNHFVDLWVLVPTL